MKASSPNDTAALWSALSSKDTFSLTDILKSESSLKSFKDESQVGVTDLNGNHVQVTDLSLHL